MGNNAIQSTDMQTAVKSFQSLMNIGSDQGEVKGGPGGAAPVKILATLCHQ